MTAWFSQAEIDAWAGLLRSHAMLDQAIDADLRAHHGLRHVEFEVLLRLAYAPGARLRLQDLAGGSLLTRSGASRLVDRLEKAGLVTREAVDEDGRGAYAALTPAGRTLFDEVAPHHVAHVRRLFHDRLTPEEIEVLGRVWTKITAPAPSGD